MSAKRLFDRVPTAARSFENLPAVPAYDGYRAFRALPVQRSGFTFL
jgi:hypothetical protein